MENKLSEGWNSPFLKEVVTSHKGKKPSSVIDHEKKGYDPYILVDELEGKAVRAYTNDPKVPRATEKDVLLVWDGSIGKCASGLSGAVGSTVAMLSPKEGLNTKYLEYFIRRSNNFIHETSTGSGLQHVNKNFLKMLEIPLPEEIEQIRIADKLDSLLAKLKDAQARLDKVRLTLQCLKRSVIEYAFNDFNDNDLVRLGDVIPKGNIFDGPFGSNLKTSDYTESGVRVIRLENVGRLKFVEDKKTYISHRKHETLLRHTIYDGDIIFASFIVDEVRVCVLPKLPTKAIAKADCFCIRTGENINPTYLAYQLSCRRIYDLLVAEIHGVTRPRINTTQLKKVDIYVPSFDDQLLVVEKITRGLGKLEHIEKYYQTAKDYTDKLEQSILAKAFRGELVR